MFMVSKEICISALYVPAIVRVKSVDLPGESGRIKFSEALVN